MAELAAPNLEDSKDNWLVYADALQNTGDPIGELIVLNQAIADGADSFDRDAHLDRHADAIYASLAPFRARVEIEWRWSVPLSLSLKIGPKDDPVALLEALLASPLAQTMKALRLVAQTPSSADKVELGPALARLADGLPASCAALELIDERAKVSRMLVSADDSPGRNLVDFGSLNAVWSIPHLRRLHMWVADTEQIDLGKVDAPELRDFAFLGLRWIDPHGSDASQMSEALAAANWPKLERLALRIPETFTFSWPEQYGAYVRVDRYDKDSEYADNYYEDEGSHENVNWSAELGGVLMSLQQTNIRHLSLTAFSSSANLLQALAEHGLASSLRTLDLSQSDLGDEDVAWMVEHAGVFASLDSLDLSDTLIDDADPLSVLAPEILYSSGGGAIYRFTVGME